MRFVVWLIPYLLTYFILQSNFDIAGFFEVLGAVAISWLVANVVQEIVAPL